MIIFNSALLKKVRRKGNMRQSDFAEKIGVSDVYISQIEHRRREPSIDVIRRLVDFTGIPVEEWLTEGNASRVTGAASDINNRRERDHLKIRQREEEIWRLEKAQDHSIAVVRFCKKVFGISRDHRLSGEGKDERYRKLVIRTIREGELNFAEVQDVTGIRRSITRNWLDAAKETYKCAQADGGMIIASSPGEASICLRCGPCMKRESGHCSGYGDEDPANIVEMFELLDAHGLYNATDQSVIFEKYYNLKYSAAYVTNIRYKRNNGIRLPDDVYYMDTEKRDV
jgi:transcriptional regulator with XRE-family HTH domain